MPDIRFPIRYYRAHPYGVGMEKPARAFQGHVEKTVEMPLGELALVLVHLWNEGFPEGPNLALEHPECAGYLEFTSRSREIVEGRIVPLLADARRAGAHVVHLVSGPYARKYPQYRATESMVGPDPAPEPGCPKPQWLTDRNEEQYGPGFNTHYPPTTDIGSPKHRDIPLCVQPLPGEYMASTGRQLNRLLRGLGVWTILYAGFNTNICVIHSSGCIWDMRLRGYRPVLLRDCTTSGEQADTVDEMRNYHAAVRSIEHFMGYTALSDHVRSALASV
jgi:nicotinamidase-related amidase